MRHREEALDRGAAVLAEGQREVVDVHQHEAPARLLVDAPAVAHRVLERLVDVRVGPRDGVAEPLPQRAVHLLTELTPRPEHIARVDVATYRFAANMREPDPMNYFAAKYSLPHAAAALIVRGNAGYHAFTEEAVRDPAITAIRRRVAVREDPALNAGVPRLKPARVTVTLTDGRQVTRLRESARGDFQDPYREDEVRAKFRELARVALSPGGVARVEELVDRLDELPRLSDLVVALTL